MKSRAQNKILAFALAAVMALGMFTSGPAVITAYAAAGDPSDGVDFTGDWVTDHKSYYFGTYNNSPILWRMLEGSDTEAFLFSENNLANRAFRDDINIWAYSDIRAYLNDETAGGFIAGLPAEINSALVETDTTISGHPLTSDKAYLLSRSEVESYFPNQDDRILSKEWYLRSPGSGYDAMVVRTDGSIAGGYASGARGVHPALKVDQSSLIFTDDEGADGDTDTTPYTLAGTGTSVSPVGINKYVQFAVDGLPIIWKVIEVSGSIITLFPTTCVGSDMAFKAYPWNKWSESTVRSFLNPDNSVYEANTFAFAAGEAPAMQTTAVSTASDTTTNDKMFLLSYDDAMNSSYFNGNSDRRASDYWWLRSPGPYDYYAAFVNAYGIVDAGGYPVSASSNAIRPAFILNPSSVIFTSEIVSDGMSDGMGKIAADSYYSAAAGGGAQNFKLTIVNTDLDLSNLKKAGESGNLSNGETLAVAPGGTIDLTGSIGGGAEKLVYKIVDRNSGKIVGYGVGTNNTDLTVNATANVTGGSLDENGDYTLYVWAQQDNRINSHEGSGPMYFTLDVQTPTIPTITIHTQPAATTNVIEGSISGSLTVAATVSGDGTLSYEWFSCEDTNHTNPVSTSETSDTFAIPTNLASGTYYYYCKVSAAGAESVNSNVATVTVIPAGPAAVPTVTSTDPINLDLNGINTSTIHVSLGQSGGSNVLADKATVTVSGSAITTTPATPTDLTADGNIEVTGVSVGQATVTIGFSGGDVVDTQYDRTITVNVTNSTSLPDTYHTISATAGTGGSISPSGDIQVAEGDSQSFMVSADSGYYISGVTVDGSGVGAVSSYTFDNVTKNHTIHATFKRYKTTSRDRDSSDSGGGSVQDTVRAAVPSVLTVDAAKARDALAEMEKSGRSRARISYAGDIRVLAEAWPVFGSVPVDFDTLEDNAVQVRITVWEPGKLTGELLLSSEVKGSIVDSRKAFFEKWFANKMRIIHLEHTGSFGQPVELAAKVDLTGMDTAKLYFYSYDKKTNTYKRIEKPAYWIDKNGYLHFATEYAGDIVISEGPLERKQQKSYEAIEILSQ